MTGKPCTVAETMAGVSEQQTWHEEQIESWHAGRRTAFVFRWVPDYAPFGGRRQEHPTYEEWIEDMRGASAGLDGPAVTHREVYDSVQYGVSGHRPMTAEEVADRAADLIRDVAAKQAEITALTGR